MDHQAGLNGDRQASHALRSIEQKIFILLLPICVLPPIVFLTLLGVGSRLTFEDALGGELSSRANSLAVQLDRFLRDQSAAARALIVAEGPDPVRLGARLGERVAADALIHVDAAERVQLHTVSAELTPSETRSLEAAVLIRNWGDSPMAPAALEGLFVDLRTTPAGQPHSSSLSMFTFSDGRRGRFFVVWKTQRLIDRFRQGLPQVSDAFMINSGKNYPVYPDKGDPKDPALTMHQAFSERLALTGWFTVKAGGRSFLVASAPSQFLRQMRAGNSRAASWFVLVSYDMENFFGPLARYVWLSILITLGLVLAMVALGWIAARHIVSPLATLRRQAEALAQGNLDVRASIRSRDEIGELADAFNTMATRLRTMYRAVEERLEDNQLRATHINVINEITSAIIQVLSLDSIFEILCRELGKIVSFDALWVALFDENAQDLRVTHIFPSGLIALFDRNRIPLVLSLHGHVVEARETLHAEIGPRHRTELFEMRIFNAEGFQSYLIAPLPSRNRIIGTLTVASAAPDAFNSRMAPVMTSLAGAVAIAIEQAELFQRISRLATELEHKVDERTRELERATQKLIHTEKYFATGRMAGNLAHEINNPLAIIKNYIRLAKDNLRQAAGGRRRGDISLQHLQIIDEEVDRIARLVRQMMDLHRPVEQTVQPVDLNQLIEEILALMEEGLELARIQVIRELAADLPRPIASPDLIRQVLINLIRNAQDAMETGGQLTIRTSVITGWERGAERQSIRLRISDTGCGIPTEHLSQIFDPFFTTKPPEKGTGLGLCVSYSIISMYGGTIDVESEFGRGASVIVTLPIEPRDEESTVRPEEEHAADTPASAATPAEGE